MTQRQQLQELVRHIIKKTLQELINVNGSVPGSNSVSNQTNVSGQPSFVDPSQPPIDAMTPAEKAKQEREQEKQRRDALKQGEVALKSAKAKMDFNKKELDQQKRFQIPTLQKKIQSLKGGTNQNGL